MALSGCSKKGRKTRRSKRGAKRRGFAGTAEIHRADASSFSKEARRVAQMTRAAAKRGDCRTALHLFGLTAFNAGMAIGNRKWIGGAKGKLFRGGSRFGSRIVALQSTVFKACRIK